MNRRIHPDDFDTSPYKELIQMLVLHWVHAELPAERMSYVDYTMAINTLLLTTQSSDRTTVIVRAVLTQAIALHKTSFWVEQELKFEGMIDGADRNDFLLLELSQATAVDDTLLDTYNERINRFTANSE
ncbi:hypothetical protein GO730_08740 [Spirosoma sp. HMF3257]|uniref:Uncharacterized protein n=1 Tax=Spirosoma telluris TaxID=2183553 RepID=A0A327NVF3_9BACT|nr:hypothetical protein [Spirosoma telluris]RAI78389.1 hypothetical protein HMF3257_08655 [Spirosoma telluris]